jgi:hypothetical protein
MGMHKTVLNCLSVIFFSIVINKAVAQQDSIKKNTIEIFPNICHYFDGTNANWGYLVVDEQDSNKKRIPQDFGIQFTRNVDESSRLRFSVLMYYMGYPYGRNNKPGDIVERQQTIFAAAYLRNIFRYKKFQADALGELNFRYGYELQHVYYYSFWESVVKHTNNRDVGATAGIKFNQKLFWNFNVFTEGSFTYFIYRYDKGNGGTYPVDVGASKQMMTLKAGLGYSF